MCLAIRIFLCMISMRTLDFKDTWDTCWDALLMSALTNGPFDKHLLTKDLPFGSLPPRTLRTLRTHKTNSKAKRERVSNRSRLSGNVS